MASDNQKKFDYNQNRYTSGYRPASPRPVKVVSQDIVISNPIVVNEIITVKGVTKVQKINPLATTTDGQLFTNDTFEFQPAAGSAAYITVNGRTTFPANGSADVPNSAFYITDQHGNVRSHGTYQIGDRFVWQGTVAGIEILADDEIKLIYEVGEKTTSAGVNRVQVVTPLATTHNGDLVTNDTFNAAPSPGSAAYITVNGRPVYPANGAGEVAISALYITDSTGVIIRTTGTYQVGDRFVWQGTVAGTQILSDDEIKIIFEV